MAFQQYPQKLGIPSGNTAGRPSSPIIGDTYYNGQLEILEIWNGTAWVAASAPPATPTIATPTDSGTANAFASGGSLTTVFTPGSGGGTPSQYNAFTTTGGFSASSSSTTVTITGLTSGTAFTVYGNAQNNFGTTVNTDNAAAVTVTTLPQIPTIGTATASGSANEITVTWTNGATGGKNLSAITITPFLNGTTAQTSRTAATTSSTSYTFTQGQLTAGAAYTFKVKATNANGTCADSTATNSATMPSFITMNYLVVAGGGGGGTTEGGGGGAGGLRSTVTASGRGTSVESTLGLVAGTNYTVTVGAGGAGKVIPSGPGTSGSNSVFSTITSTGGGGGGKGATGSDEIGLDGGCGGGGGSSGGANSKVGGAGTTAQGFGGGTGGTGDWGAGGGGGTGAAGANGSTSSYVGGNGGAGTAVSITGSSVTYGGGGGGGIFQTGTGGTGGSGGGGTASNTGSGNGGAGTANTGGGGAGGNYNGGNGGNGGSGVVILRWLTADGSITVGAGLTADATGTDGTFSYKRFTAGTGTVNF